MGIRPSIQEQLNASRWIEIDQSGNKTYKSNSSATLHSTYSFTMQNHNNSGNQFLPSSYTILGFDRSCFDSSYKYKYRNINTKYTNFVYIYINSLSPIISNPYESGAWAIATPGYEADFPERLRADNVLYGWNDPGYASISWQNSNDTERIGVGIRLYYSGTTYRYSGTASIFCDGIGTLNPPYTRITWERCDPLISNVSPASGSFVDDTHDLTINWNLDIATSESGIVYNPTEIAFLWGTDENVSNSIPVNTNATSIIISANTFPSQSTVYWKIRWKSDAADEYFYTNLSTYKTTDSIGSATIVSPTNASIDGEVDNVFVWSYANDTGTSQKAFDLQISNDDGNTWTTLFSHSEASQTQAIIPANTFLAGTGMWRVRGYNTDNVASEWSDIATIIVRAAPQPPVISSVTHTPKITVSWQSTGQQAYQITANDYDSGVIFGTKKTFIIPNYYMEGEKVEISVRIKNRFGEWSEPARITVQITNVSPGIISATANAQNENILLNWTSEGTFSRFYILRNNKIIGKTETPLFVDYTVAGTNLYQIMGVNADEYYALSNEISITAKVENAVISNIETIDWIHLTVKRGNIPEFNSEQAESIAYQFYSGRILPVPYSSRFQTVIRVLDFTINLPELQKLRSLVGKIVIYKDYTGEKIIGIMDDLQTSGRTNRPDVSISITAIDYTEEIDLEQDQTN